MLHHLKKSRLCCLPGGLVGWVAGGGALNPILPDQVPVSPVATPHTTTLPCHGPTMPSCLHTMMA